MGSDLAAVTLDLSIDWRVLGFTATASLGATLLFGLAPALGLGRVEPNDALKEQGRTVAGERRLGLRHTLVVAQVGLSFALVVAAGLFVRTSATMIAMPLGFDPSNLLIVRVDAAPGSVRPEYRVAFAQRVADAVRPALPPGQRTVWINALGPGWFETYGMRVIAGRDIAASDTAGTEQVAVANQAFVRWFAGDQSVIGERVESVVPGRLNALIVGVVNDSVYRSLRQGVVPTMYLPIAQASLVRSAFSVTARLTAPRARVERNIADAIGKAAPDLAFTFRDYGDQVRATMIQERLVALMTGFFGALAMLLAALGLYGVTAYSVGRRRAEIAVRMALGASARGVVRLVLGRVATLILAGAAIGVVLSLWAAKFVGTLLFGVDARDPTTLVAAAAVLVSVGLFAGWLPARKVSRVDPTIALRT